MTLRRRGYLTERTQHRIRLKWKKGEKHQRARFGKSKFLYDWEAESDNYKWVLSTTTKQKGAGRTGEIVWVVGQFYKDGRRVPRTNWYDHQYSPRTAAEETVERWVAEHDSGTADQTKKGSRKGKIGGKVIKPFDMKWFTFDTYNYRTNLGPYGYIELIGKLNRDKTAYRRVDIFWTDGKGKRTSWGHRKRPSDAKITARKKYGEMLKKDGVK